MKQLHLDAAQIHRGLIGEHDVGLARLMDAQEIRADVLVRHDIDAHLPDDHVAARVIAVVVRVEQVLDGQGRYFFHLRQHLRHVFRELVVDQDQALRSHAHRRVARLVNQAVVLTVGLASAGSARQEGPANYVQSLLYLVDAHRP